MTEAQLIHHAWLAWTVEPYLIDLHANGFMAWSPEAYREEARKAQDADYARLWKKLLADPYCAFPLDA